MSVLGRSYCCHSTRTGQLCPSPASAYVAAVDAAVLRAWSVRAGSSTAEAQLALAALAPAGMSVVPQAGLYQLAVEADPASRREAVRSLVRQVTVSRGPRGRRFDPSTRMAIEWSVQGAGG